MAFFDVAQEIVGGDRVDWWKLVSASAGSPVSRVIALSVFLGSFSLTMSCPCLAMLSVLVLLQSQRADLGMMTGVDLAGFHGSVRGMLSVLESDDAVSCHRRNLHGSRPSRRGLLHRVDLCLKPNPFCTTNCMPHESQSNGEVHLACSRGAR